MTSSLLTTHHTAKLLTTHHTIMAHLHYTFSPGDLADSIAGHITGESAKECIEKATVFLTKFGYSAVPMSRLNWQQQQQPPLAYRQQRLANGRLSGTWYLYCRHCTTYNQPTYFASNYTFQCCVVAGFQIRQVSNQHTLRFTELYPHAKECGEINHGNHIRSNPMVRNGTRHF